MVGIYTKLKEDNLHEENKLKATLAHSKELDMLKSNNEILQKQIEHLKKELEDRAKFIQNLPSLLKDNIEDKKHGYKEKQELKDELEKKFKQTLKESGKNFEKEFKLSAQKYENLLKQKDSEMESFKNEINMIKSRYDVDMSKNGEEQAKIYELLTNLLESYKKLFDSRKFGTNPNSITAFTNFLKAKENFDKVTEATIVNLTRYNFPLLFCAIENKKQNLSYSAKNIIGFSVASLDKLKKNEAVSIKNSQKNNLLQSPFKKSYQSQYERHEIEAKINLNNYNKKDLSISVLILVKKLMF